MAHIGNNPQALAGVVTSLGGTVHEGTKHFTFELPINKVADAIPKLIPLGIRCEKVDEYVGTNPHSGKTENIAVLEAIKVR